MRRESRTILSGILTCLILCLFDCSTANAQTQRRRRAPTNFPGTTYAPASYSTANQQLYTVSQNGPAPVPVPEPTDASPAGQSHSQSGQAGPASAFPPGSATISQPMPTLSPPAVSSPLVQPGNQSPVMMETAPAPPEASAQHPGMAQWYNAGMTMLPPEAVEICEPGTLFQWVYGGSMIGGPDLSTPLITDRPSFTRSSNTVGKGVVQFEFGYTFTHEREDGISTRTQSVGEPLFRIGTLAEWFEFRIGLSPLAQRISTFTTSDNRGGVSDLYLGFKIALTPQQGILPEMALLPQVTLPTGSGDFSADEALPGLNWIYTWQLTRETSLTGSTQFNRAVDTNREGYTEWAQSFVLTRPLTKHVGSFVEWYGRFPNGADTAKTENYFDGGLTVLLSRDVQFDIRSGVGLNRAADDYFIGTGLSIRFH